MSGATDPSIEDGLPGQTHELFRACLIAAYHEGLMDGVVNALMPLAERGATVDGHALDEEAVIICGEQITHALVNAIDAKGEHLLQLAIRLMSGLGEKWGEDFADQVAQWMKERHVNGDTE